MATGSTVATHPLLACAARIEEALAEVVGPDGALVVDPDYLPVGEKADLLVGLHRVGTQVTAFHARVLAGAADVADEEGFKDPGSWLASVTRGAGQRARGLYMLGRRLRRRPATAQAHQQGQITTEHAAAVVASVDQLPVSLGAELIASVEATLVDYCAEHTPAQIRRLGAHALQVAAPDEADAILEKQLAAAEERARAKTELTIRDQGDGTARVSGLIPSLSAAVLTAAIDAYTNPHRAHHDHGTGGVHEPAHPGAEPTGDPEVDRLSPAQKRGRAFCALLEHLPTDGLPVSGGTPVAVMVTIAETQLRQAAGSALLDDDAQSLISVGEVRRLLCTHGAMPLVLGGASVILDHGRNRRDFTDAQIRAKRAVQRTCQARGCTVPSRWCHAHHECPWSEGGCTDIDHLILLCPHHHQRVHDPGYSHQYEHVRDPVRGDTKIVRFRRLHRRT